MNNITNTFKENTIITRNDDIFRVLRIKDNSFLAIDCRKRTMPVWMELTETSDYMVSPEQDIRILLKDSADIELSQRQTAEAHRRYTIISGILPVLDDQSLRDRVITKISADNGISKQTVRKYFTTYLVFQDVSSLSPNKKKGN